MLKTFPLFRLLGVCLLLHSGVLLRGNSLDSLRQVFEAYAQESPPADSQELLDLHIQLGEAYMAARYFDSAIVVFQQGLPLSKDPFSRATLHYELGYCHQVESNYPQAITHTQQAYEETTEEVPLQFRTAVLHQLAQLKVNAQKLDEALRHEFRGLLLAERAGDSLVMAKVYGGIARVYHYAEFKERALQYDLKAMRIKSRLGKAHDRYRGYVDVASSYLELSQLDSTFHFAKRAQEEAEEMGFGHGLAFSTLLLGEAHKRNGNLDQAQDLLNDARSQFRTLGRTWPIADALFSYGDVLSLVGETLPAIDTLESALALAEQIPNNDLRIDVSEQLSQLYKQVGNSKQAGYYEQEFERLKAEFQDAKADSLAFLEMKFLMAEAETKFLQDKSLLEREILEQKQELRVRSLNQTILALGLLGSIFLMAFIHAKYRTYKDQNRHLAQEKEETFWDIQYQTGIRNNWKKLSDRMYGEVHERLKAVRQTLYAEGIEQGVPIFTTISPQLSSLYREIRYIDGALTQLRHLMEVGIADSPPESLEKLTLEDLLVESRKMIDPDQRKRLHISMNQPIIFHGDHPKFVLLCYQLQLFILEYAAEGPINLKVLSNFDKEVGAYEVDYLLSFRLDPVTSREQASKSWHLEVCKLLLQPFGGKLWVEELSSSGIQVNLSYPWDKMIEG